MIEMSRTGWAAGECGSLTASLGRHATARNTAVHGRATADRLLALAATAGVGPRASEGVSAFLLGLESPRAAALHESGCSGVRAVAPKPDGRCILGDPTEPGEWGIRVAAIEASRI